MNLIQVFPFFYADISQTSRFTDTTKDQLKLDLLLPELLQHTVGVEHGSVLHLFDVGTRFRSLGEKKNISKTEDTGVKRCIHTVYVPKYSTNIL